MAPDRGSYTREMIFQVPSHRCCVSGREGLLERMGAHSLGVKLFWRPKATSKRGKIERMAGREVPAGAEPGRTCL